MSVLGEESFRAGINARVLVSKDLSSIGRNINSFKDELIVRTFSTFNSVGFAVSTEVGFAFLAFINDFDESISAFIETFAVFKEVSFSTGCALFQVLASFAFRSAFLAVFSSKRSFNIFDEQSFFVLAGLNALVSHSEGSSFALFANSGAVRALSAVFVVARNTLSSLGIVEEAFSAVLDALVVLKEGSGLALVAGEVVFANLAEIAALGALVDIGGLVTVIPVSDGAGVEALAFEEVGLLVALDAGLGVGAEAIFAVVSAGHADFIVDEGESKSALVNALAVLEEESGGADFAGVGVFAGDAVGSALLAFEEVEEVESSGAVGLADAFFLVEFVLASDASVGGADIAVGVFARSTFAVELVVSVGAGGDAGVLEEVVVGLADIAG